MIIGAMHEKGRRAGTTPVPSIVGLGTACELAQQPGIHGTIKYERSIRDAVLGRSDARNLTEQNTVRNAFPIRHTFHR